MNASDIIKAKQNKTLYNAYYTPTVYSSTIYSTLNAFSSIYAGGPVVSYTSCINTAYKTVCNPTFTSYETLNQIKDGAYECGAASHTPLQFTGIPNTAVYANTTIYSTYTNAQGIVQPYSFFVTSTMASIPTGPVISPFITYRQGCAQCSPTGCTNCLIGL